MGWRNKISEYIKDMPENCICYNFGIYNGDSMLEIYRAFRRGNRNLSKMYCFDSFVGFPETTEHYQDILRQGELSSCKFFNTNNVEDCINQIKQKTQTEMQGTELIFVPGFLNESLINAPIECAHYIDIDVDLYSSTIEALEFIFSKKIVQKGTLIGYDDWGGSPNYATYGDGESRAHKEIEDKYKVDFELLNSEGSGFPHVHRLYRINNDVQYT